MTSARKSAAHIALLLVVVAAFMVGAQPIARASCSFVSTSLREQVDDAEAVIVGTVTEAGVVDTAAPKAPRVGRPLRWTIDIERDVKDNVGDAVSFHAGSQGGFTSTQFGARLGERVGVLLSRRDDGWWASDCDKRSPGDVLAAAEPLPPPRGRGVPLLLASGGFGSPRVALLDERGVFTQFGEGAGDAVISVCPGERFAAEAITDRSAFADEDTPTSIEIRDLRSMEIVRRHRLPHAISMRVWHRPFAIACRDARALDVLVAAEAGIYSARVVRLRRGKWTTAYHNKGRAVRFLPDGFAVIKHGGERFELIVHRPDGAVRMKLGPLPTFKHLSISEPVNFVADASGRFVAAANEEPRNGLDNLFVADLAKRKVVRTRVPWVAGLAWAGTDLIVAPTLQPDRDGQIDERKGGDVHVLGTDLVRKHSWKRWTGLHPVVLGDRLYGVRPTVRHADGSTGPVSIVSAPYLTGPERVENGLGGLAVDQLIALTGEGALVDRRPRLTWTAVALIVLFVLLAVIFIRSKRQRITEPGEVLEALS